MASQSIDKKTVQAPINSGFGPMTTAQEALGKRDLTGKVAIVTGGSSGIGLDITKVLAGAGATVVVPVLPSLMAEAKTNVAGLPKVELEPMDLIDPASIDAFAKKFIASGRPLHMLINNAGILGAPLRRDARGYESQLAINHLGHYQLTARLWPALKKANGARIAAVSSFAHHMGAVDFDDPNYEHREYSRMGAYGQSKSAVSLFVVALDKRAKAQNVRAFAVHPGVIPNTNLGYDLDPAMRPQFTLDKDGMPVGTDMGVPYKATSQGAATSIWCATSPQLDGMGGVYCQDCDIAVANPADSKSNGGVWPWAIDPELAEKLWTLSEKLTGVKFEF